MPDNQKAAGYPLADGILYPADPEELKKTIIKSLEKNSEDSANAVLFPHASYNFCSKHIGSAFSRLAGNNPDCIILLAPVHREKKPEIYLPSFEYFYTPLGKIKIDREKINRLSFQSGSIRINDMPFQEEIGIETALPYVCYLFPGVPVLPVYTGDLSFKTVQTLNRVLSLLISDSSSKEKNLIGISSNLTEFDLSKKTEKEMELFISLCNKGDYQSIMESEKDHKISACGAASVSALFFSGKFSTGELVSLSSQTELTGNKEKKIHYGSFTFRR